ncbi:MAG: DoxX family protein [Chitinophagaceae bacterium]|nr:MAG: DoxX family protein [Chitinophagaceae bacterium]
MAVAYIAAGINHFVHPQTYLAIMPPWLPAHAALVFVSGVLEVLFGLLLLPLRIRHAAAWGLILLLVAVFPANIQMLINYYREGHPHLWLAVLRLPLQVVLIWWAYQYTKPVK